MSAERGVTIGRPIEIALGVMLGVGENVAEIVGPTFGVRGTEK
jgi:hypothetical protein